MQVDMTHFVNTWSKPWGGIPDHPALRDFLTLEDLMSSLKGKVIIITGASSGFGASAAKLFAQEGCKVVLAARRLDKLEALATELRAIGAEALPVAMDVSQLAQIDDMVRSTLDAYGRIDILFNNAGFGRLDWFEALDPVKDIQGQITVDLLGVIWTARAVVPQSSICVPSADGRRLRCTLFIPLQNSACVDSQKRYGVRQLRLAYMSRQCIPAVLPRNSKSTLGRIGQRNASLRPIGCELLPTM
jgi:short chain dehydrogenase